MIFRIQSHRSLGISRKRKVRLQPQLEVLRIIHQGLGKKAHFVETIFNPWNVAEKLFFERGGAAAKAGPAAESAGRAERNCSVEATMRGLPYRPELPEFFSRLRTPICLC